MTSSYEADAGTAGHVGLPLEPMRQRGFAYIWTLLLVAFMGVGLVIGSEIYSTSLQREKERELLFIGREFADAIGRYVESDVAGAGGQRQYPATLDDLLKDPRFPNAQRHLRRIYRDPMTGKNEWGVVLVKGRIAGVHSLSDKMPIKQDNFEAQYASFRGKEKYSDWTFTYPAGLLVLAPKEVTRESSRPDNVNGASANTLPLPETDLPGVPSAELPDASPAEFNQQQPLK